MYGGGLQIGTKDGARVNSTSTKSVFTLKANPLDYHVTDVSLPKAELVE